jgi:hypothetical protein
MKRSILDITQKISRKPGKVILSAKDLNDADYWIFEGTGWRFVGILREIQYRETQDRVKVYINTQSISNRDFLIEESPNGLIVKFIKNKFQYSLDTDDYIEVIGDIEKYA